MKPAFEALVGNVSLRNRLAQDILDNSLSHAYILEGPAGCGKHTLALHLAAALACERKGTPGVPLPCTTCPSCRKILERKSPDILTFGREDKATLGVDTVRRIRESVPVYPNELDTKVYIIEDAHTMTVQAQNAFLLTLEEPPAFVCFLLLCENTQPLLETIKSRAPILRMQPVKTADMDAFLCRTDSRAAQLRATSNREWQELLSASEGTIGMALTLLNPKTRDPVLARRQLVRDFLDLTQSPRERTGQSILMGDRIGKTREEICQLFQTMELALRDLLALKKEENAPLLFYTDRDAALTLSDRLGTTAILRMYEAAEKARASVFVRNENTRLAWMDFILDAGMIR